MAVWLVWVALDTHSVLGSSRQPLEYRPAPVDNPLKGLVPFQGDRRDQFPHSLEFNYVPYSALVKGYDSFDWEPLETLLDDMASRGHQAIFRIFLEYPNQTGIIPEFLIHDGLQVHRYLNTNTQPLPPAVVETPDYEDANLRRSLRNFIGAMAGESIVAVRVPHPLLGGPPVRLANTTQDADLPGWLSLGVVRIP
jgi:hypothetical protein